ncbi:ATP-binding protein [Isoptericola sp. AK164]|uniref:ATP-binding protein n=1 Tax=Isoptericola sp. AK164 TaxID=3024246 RepID=UPI00241899F3|nr:ATP-binding protein [Isoptericola sp. AK164]
MTSTIERHVRGRALEGLDDTRVVVVQGARQVGKTTLVRDLVRAREGRLVTLDDELTRLAARSDPTTFLRQSPDRLLAIDEVQRAPELVLALKAAVDEDPRPGRFLLTGSADLLRLPAAEDSLAGRAESIELLGFSQGELTGHRERFVDRLLSGELFLDHGGALERRDYLDRAVAGAYPEALARTTARRRNQWLDNYLARIVERDARDVSAMQTLDRLPDVLRILAARNAEELNVSGLANALNIPATTLTRQLDLLETLYLVHRVPAWSTNLSKRVVARPKSMLLDSGLAARLINVTTDGLAPGAHGNVAGHLLEAFVSAEIRRHQGWADESFRISHYRDRAGGEVDLILETGDGRVAGLEIKATARVTGGDSRWLTRLRDHLGKRFVAGIVLHTGPTSAPLGDRLAAVPLDVLWRT